MLRIPKTQMIKLLPPGTQVSHRRVQNLKDCCPCYFRLTKTNRLDDRDVQMQPLFVRRSEGVR